MTFGSRLKVLTYACVIIMLALAFYTAYDLNGDSLDFSDKKVVLVATDSMDGDVHDFAIDSYPADTVLMIEYVPAHEIRLIRVGEVAVYHSGDMLITHRVVGVDLEKSCLIVKGDNSSLKEEVAFDDVVGVVVGTNQWLGAAISFVKANLMGILIVGFIILVGSLSVYRYKNTPDKKRTKMGRGVAFGITMVAVFGMAFAGIGYAYTASTENSGNSISSEYVVLAQSNYTFSAGTSFTYYSITSSADTYYYIADDDPAVKRILDTDSGGYAKHNNKFYWGVRIGDPTTLSISSVNYDISNTMRIQVRMSTVDNECFTKFTTNNWLYFMKICYIVGGKAMDIHWLWSKGNGWNNLVGSGTSDGKVAKIDIDPTKNYVAELYFGSPGITVSGMTVTEGTTSSKTCPGCKTEPKGNTGLDSSGRMLIKDGWVSFAFDINDNLPVITFDKNGGTGTMSSQTAAYGAETQLKTNTFTNSRTFRGWNTSPDGTGIQYDDGGSITVTRSVTLYAQWD